MVDAERAEAAGVGDSGGQRHARQPAAERALDERPIEIQEPADAGVRPAGAGTDEIAMAVTIGNQLAIASNCQ